MLRTLFLALAAFIVLAAPSAAAVQTTTDPADGYVDGNVKSTDWRSITWDTTTQPGTALLKIELQYAASQDMGGAIFLDTDQDGKADYTVEISAASGASQHPDLDGNGGHANWYLRHVVTSTTSCQSYDDGTGAYVNPYAQYNVATATRNVSADARTSFTIPIALSDIGNATSFKWAVAGQSSNGFAQLYDFAPDAANGIPARDPHSGSVGESDDWFCSPAGDGLSAGFVVDMSKGTLFDTNGIAPPPPVNQAPVATVSQSPELARPGQPVTLTAAGSDSDGSVVEYAWDLDDNTDFSDASGTTVTKTFATAGTYRVGVRVKDNQGAYGFGYRTIEVANRPATLSLTASKLNPVKSEKIDITANVGSDVPLDANDVQWALVYGVSDDDSGAYDKNVGRSWHASYGAPGPWTVKARFTNQAGQTAYARIQINVPNQKPVLRDFRIRTKLTPDNPFNTEPMVKGKPILLTIGYTDDDFPTPPRAEWDLDGDGSYDDAVGSTVEHTYADAGEKKVSVRVVDSAGQFVIGDTSFEIRESADAGCNGKAGDDELRLVGCFKTDSKDKGLKTTKDPVDLDGLKLVPQDGAQINVQAVGGVLFVTGPGTVQIVAGNVVLFDGRFQLEPNCDRTKTECLLGKFNAPAFSKLKGLPVKGEVEVYLNPKGTRVHVNVDIFGTVGIGPTGKADLHTEDGKGLILDSLEVRSFMVPLGDLTIGQFFIKYDGTTRVWEGGGDITLPTPQFTKLTGDFAFSELTGFQRAHGEVDGLNVPIDEFGTVYLQRIAFTIEAKGFEPGGKPRIRLGGGIGISAGPRVASVTIATVDGDFLVTFGDPFGIDIEGRIGVAGFDIFGGSVSAYTNGDVAMEGTIKFGLPFPKAFKGQRQDATKLKISRFTSNGADVYRPLFQIVGVSGTAKAWVEPQAFDLEAQISAQVIGITLAKAQGLLSSKGVAGCGEIVGIAGGFGYNYETEKTDLFSSSCDLGPWRPERTFKPLDDNGAGLTGRQAADTGSAPPATAIDVAQGQKALVVRLTGQGGKPIVTLVAPDGTKYEMPADGGVVQRDDFFAARNPQADETILGVRAPQAGRWTIVPQAGSVPIAGVDGAAVLPDPKVSATVSGTGATRTVSYKVKEIPGQTVSFVEQGDDSHRTVGVAKGASGSFTFTPQEGKDRTRQIIAIVAQGGRDRAHIPVAAFMAPPVWKPGRPRDLVATRNAKGKPAGVSLAWKKVAGVTAYEVMTHLPTGEVRFNITRAPRFGVAGIGARTAVTFNVRAAKTTGKTSRWTTIKLPAGVARIPRLKKPPHPVVHPALREALTLF